MGVDTGKILEKHGKFTGAQFAFAGMNFMVDPADLPLTEGQAVDICNCDVDYKNNISRRKGYVCLMPGVIANAWSNGEDTYCTVNNILCSVVVATNTATVVSIIGVNPLAGTVEFKQCNDVVVFSDGITIGILQGTQATILPEPIFLP